MEIYKTPEFLVVHFKRFSHTRNSMFGSRKLNTMIDFPVLGLDLSSYVLSGIQGNEQTLGSQDADINPNQVKYDLYAVSNHYGTMNGGHYTAFCESPVFESWYEFDDSVVTKIAKKGTDVSSYVVGKAAYVLFYRKRKQD